MPKILDAKMQWNNEWANSPCLEVLVDKMPDSDDMVYKFKKGLWFAHKDGWVSFYAHNGNNENHGGFGGRSFDIKTKDGKKTLHGPWSSRSSACNSAGFPLSMEVHVIDDREGFNRGFTFTAGWSLSLPALKKVLKKFLPDCTVLLVMDYGEPTLQIALKDGRFKPKPKTNCSPNKNRWVVASEKDVKSVMDWNKSEKMVLKNLGNDQKEIVKFDQKEIVIKKLL